jgi:hypothetical protein
MQNGEQVKEKQYQGGKKPSEGCRGFKRKGKN